MSNNVLPQIAGFSPVELTKTHPRRSSAIRRFAALSGVQKANIRYAVSRAIGEKYDADKEREHLDEFARRATTMPVKTAFADLAAAQRAYTLCESTGVLPMLAPDFGDDAA